MRRWGAAFRRVSWLRRAAELLGLLVVWPALGAPDCPRIGAIRWDAWYGATDTVGRSVEASLSPAHWQARAPFCSEIVSPDALRIDCARQEVMDQEIEYARAAGIDYWAFVAYAPERPLTAALNLYRTSSKRHLVNFAMLTGTDFFRDPANFVRVRNRFIMLMKEPGYQTVLGNRPLLFVGFVNDRQVMTEWGSHERLREAFQELRGRAMAEGLGNPYLVMMDSNPARAAKLRARLGFDAVSSYAAQGNAIHGTYERLTAHVRTFWKRARASGSQVVPTVMAGWDPRPRIETPGHWPRPDDARAMQRYYETPTPAQLAAHVEQAVHWVWAHPSATEANTIIAYAWNEHDEGGWIAPTLGEGDARVRAIGERVRALRALGSATTCQP